MDARRPTPGSRPGWRAASGRGRSATSPCRRGRRASPQSRHSRDHRDHGGRRRARNSSGSSSRASSITSRSATPSIRRCGQRIGELWGVPSGIDMGGRPTVALAQLVEGGIGGDPVGPRRERGPAVEARQPAHDRDHRLLGRIVGIPTRAGNSPADRVYSVVVATEQGVEGGAVAGLRSGDERPVIGVSAVRIATGELNRSP